MLAVLTLLLPLVNADTRLPFMTCTSNIMNQSHTVSGAVTINTHAATPFEDVKLSAINETAWESYSFEGVSSLGSSGVSITFYRNPSVATLGNGVVWVEINAVWRNGTQWNTILWQDQSNIIVCDVDTNASTYGYWLDDTDITTRFSFRVPRTLASAHLNFVSSSVEGSWALKSIAPAMTANGMAQLSSLGSVELAPLIYWNEAIPMGTMNASIELSGTKFDLEGFGGHWRNWAAYNWNSLARRWYRVRAVAGPYTIIYWVLTSAVDGQTYTSGILTQNGTKIFATRNGAPVDGSSSAIFWLAYSGHVRGSYEDSSTGITLYFVGGGRQWRFSITHMNVLSEPSRRSTESYTSFVNKVVGGDISGAQYEGVGTSDQAVIANPVPL